MRDTEEAFHRSAVWRFYRELGDRVGIANCLSLLGSVARGRGQYPLAAARLEEAAVLFRKHR